MAVTFELYCLWRQWSVDVVVVVSESGRETCVSSTGVGLWMWLLVGTTRRVRRLVQRLHALRSTTSSARRSERV